MQHFRSLDDVHLSDVWLTIGSFDGVHLGHQSLINDLIAGAKLTGLPAVVITFFPHPSAILRGRNLPYYLCTPDEKIEELRKLCVSPGWTTMEGIPWETKMAGVMAAVGLLAVLIPH